jgi:hypothetical protein
MSIDPITGGIDPEGKEDKTLTEGLTTPKKPKYQVGTNGRLYDIGASTLDMADPTKGESIELPNIASLDEKEREELRRNLTEMGVEPQGIDTLVKSQESRDKSSVDAVKDRPETTKVTGTIDEPEDPFESRLAGRGELQFLLEGPHQGNMESRRLSDGKLTAIEILRRAHTARLAEDNEYARQVDQQMEATGGIISATHVEFLQSLLNEGGHSPNSADGMEVLRYAAFGGNEDFFGQGTAGFFTLTGASRRDANAFTTGLRETLGSVRNMYNVFSGLAEEDGSQEQMDDFAIARSFQMLPQLLDPTRRRSMVREEDDELQKGTAGEAALYTLGAGSIDILMVMTGAGVVGAAGKKLAGKAAVDLAKKQTAMQLAKAGAGRGLVAKTSGSIGGAVVGSTRTTQESAMTMAGSDEEFNTLKVVGVGVAKGGVDFLPVAGVMKRLKGNAATAGVESGLSKALSRYAGTNTVERATRLASRRRLAETMAHGLVVAPTSEGGTELLQTMMDDMVGGDIFGFDSGEGFNFVEAQNVALAGMIAMGPFGVTSGGSQFQRDQQQLNKIKEQHKRIGMVATAVANAADGGSTGIGIGFEAPTNTAGMDANAGAVAAGQMRLVESGAQAAALLTQAQLDTLTPDQTEGKGLVPVGEGYVLFDPNTVSEAQITAASDNGTLGAFVGNFVGSNSITTGQSNGAVALVDAEGNIVSVMAFDQESVDLNTVHEFQSRRASMGGGLGVIHLDGAQKDAYMNGEQVLAPADAADFFAEGNPNFQAPETVRVSGTEQSVAQQTTHLIEGQQDVENKEGTGVTVTEVSESDLTQEQKSVVESGRKLGKKVVFMQGTNADGEQVSLVNEGLMTDRAVDVIMLDSQKQVERTWIDIMLHEFDHHLKRDNPELHRALMASITESGMTGQWMNRDQENDLRKTLSKIYGEPADSEFMDSLVQDMKDDAGKDVAQDITRTIEQLEREGRTEEATAVRQAVDGLRAEMTADTNATLARRVGLHSDLNPDASTPQRVADWFRRRLAQYGVLGREAQIYIGAMQAQMEGLPFSTAHVGTVEGGKEVVKPATDQEAQEVVKGAGSEDTVSPLEELNRRLKSEVGTISEIDQMVQDIADQLSPTASTPEQRQIQRQRKRHHGRRSRGESEVDLRFSRGVSNGENTGLRSLANDYAKGVGLPSLNTAVTEVDSELHRRLADELDAVEHQPSDEQVVRAYNKFKGENMAQFNLLLESGYNFVAHSQEGMEPYQPPVKGSPDQRSPSKKMRDQVADEKTLVFYPTIQEDGGDFLGDHPLMERTGITVPTDGGGEYELTHNDVFRVVHDIFGHAKEGSSFGMVGEENAVVQHSQMYTEGALPALIAETRMQNAFMHFGGHLRREDGSIPTAGEVDFVPYEERPFAEQKVFIPSPEAMALNLPVEEGKEAEDSHSLRASKRVSDGKRVLARDVLGRNVAYLTDDEIGKVGRRATAESIRDHLKSFPSVAHLTKAAEMGRPMAKWYQAASLTIDKAAEGMEIESWRLAGVLAATSPSKSVEASVKVALGVIKDWKDSGRTLSPTAIRESVERHGGLGADMNNTVRALTAETEQEMELSGLKVTAFRKALNGDLSQVVGDTLMARAYGIFNKRMSNIGEFLASTILVRKIAEKTGMDPAEAQAAIWVVSRTTSGRVSASRQQQAKAEAKGKKPTRGVKAIAESPIEASEVFRGDDIASLLSGRSRQLTTGEQRSMRAELQAVGVDTDAVDAALTEWEAANPEATPEGWKSRSLVEGMGSLGAARRLVKDIDNSFRVAEKNPAKNFDLRASLSVDRDNVGMFKMDGEQPGRFIKLDMFGPEAKRFVEDSSVDLTDADGDPLVMFHGGTLKDGGRIVTSAFGAAGPGSYMASNISVALSYAPEGGNRHRGKTGGVFPLIVAPTGLVLQQDISSLIAHEETFGQDLRNWPSMSDISNITRLMDTGVNTDLDGTPLGIDLPGLNASTATQEQSRKGKGGSFGGTHHPINDLLDPNTKTPLLKLNYETAPLGKPLPMHTYVGKDGSVYQLIGFQIDGNIADKSSNMIGHFVKAEGQFVDAEYAGVASVVDNPGDITTSFGRSSMFMNDLPRVQVTFDGNSDVVSSSDTSAFPVGQEISTHAKGNQLGGTFTGITNIRTLRTQLNMNVGRQIGQLRKGASHVLKSDKPMLVSMRGVEVPLSGTFRLPAAHKHHLGISGTFMQFGGLSLNLSEVGSARSAMPGEANFGKPDVEHIKSGEAGLVSGYNIRASIRGNQGDMEFVDDLSTRVQRGLIDRFVDLRHARDELKSRGKLREDRDFYSGVRLQDAKIQQGIQDYRDDTIQPFAQLMAENDISDSELEEYAYALHAKERNAQIAKVNPDMADGGSGMTNAEADAIIAKIAADPRSMAFQELAGMLQNIQLENLSLLQEAGLITLDEEITLGKTYNHYVPLQGISDPIEAETRREMDAVMPGPKGTEMGKGGTGMRKAKGRAGRAPDVLANALMRRGDVLARIYKNRTANRLLRGAIALNEPSLFNVVADKPEGVDGYASRPEVQTVHLEKDMRINGKQKKAGDTVYIEVASPELVAVLNKSTNAGNSAADTILRVSNMVIGGMRFMITQFAPEFMLRNIVRDAQTAVLAQSAEQGKGLATLRKLGDALKTTLGHEFGKAGPLESEYQEMISEGGRQAGYSRLDLDAIADDMRKARRALKNGGRVTRSGWKKAFGWILDVGQALENVSRLSTYVVSRDGGMTKEQAALRARDVTVDFSRKGTWGGALNMLYLYSNAGLQGSARLVESTITSKNGKRVVAGLTGIGALATYWNAAMDEEDPDTGLMGYDLIPEWEKRSHAIFMIPGSGGDYMKIPLPYGFHMIYNVGTTTAEVANGTMSLKDGLGRFAMTGLDTFNPISGSGVTANFASSAVPTPVKPLADLALNRNFAGNRIYANQSFGYQGPRSQQGFDTTPDMWKDLAAFMNEVTGGDQYEPGFIDQEPEVFRHVYSAFSGDIGRTVGRLSRLAEAVTDEEAMEIMGTSREDVPWLRTFVGTVTERDRDTVYRELRADTQKVYVAYKSAAEAGDVPKMEEIEKRDPNYLELALIIHAPGGFESANRKIKQGLKQVRAIQDTAEHDGSRKDELELVRAGRVVRNEALRLYGAVLKEQRGQTDEKKNDFGTRVDGTPKGEGFLGRIEGPDGKPMTEVSIQYDDVLDGKPIPTLVPTLTSEEIAYLRKHGTGYMDSTEDPKMVESIQRKAIDHARERDGKGLSPFAD